MNIIKTLRSRNLCKLVCDFTITQNCELLTFKENNNINACC